MKSTILSTRQLAEALGVSRWTVSRALNGHPDINPATAEKIREAAREYRFAPSILGRSLRQGKTDLVGICLPDLVDYFLVNKISRLNQAIEALGLHPLLHIVRDTHEDEIQALGRFTAIRCQAVILMASPLKPDHPALTSLHHAEIPTLHIDPFHPGHPVTVSTDRSVAMEKAVAHLHKKGHRRFCLFGINPATSYGRQRVKGFKKAAREHGFSFDDVYRFYTHAAWDGNDFEYGAALAQRWLKEGGPKHPHTGIIAINDRVAQGAINALHQAGMAVPQKVGVVGYDNADFSAHTAPALTTIDPHVDLLADQTALLLGGIVHGSKRRRQVKIKPTLIERSSS